MMSKIYVLSYQDFGALLTQGEFLIEFKKYQGSDLPIFENIFTFEKLKIVRRFFKQEQNLFEDDHSEPLLPEDITRLNIFYQDTDVYVISSFEFEQNYKNCDKNEYGMVLIEKREFNCQIKDLEQLSEDVVILASNGYNLNDPSSLS